MKLTKEILESIAFVLGMIGILMLLGLSLTINGLNNELNNLKYEINNFYTTTLNDFEEMVEGYERQIELCQNEKTQDVNNAKEELIDNCENYMCESPCGEMEQEVSRILCSKIHSGQGNLYT